MSDPLIWVRAIHFAAAIAVAGTILFHGFVAQLAFVEANCQGPLPSMVRSQREWTVWSGLGVLVVSGVLWLVLSAAQMADLPPRLAIAQGLVWTVLGDTGFGHDWIVRFIMAALLAGVLIWRQTARPQQKSGMNVEAVLAAALVGSLAWAGHAAAGSWIEGDVHLLADTLHLIAAAAWVGALVPLALLLRAARRCHDEPSGAVARAAVRRFSTLGIGSVGTLVMTGLVNSWELVGGLPALVDTAYGRLLLVKIALFAGMAAIAGINRLWLTPRLLQTANTEVSNHASRLIARNSCIEAGIGAMIVVIVAVLGTMAPAIVEQAAN